MTQTRKLFSVFILRRADVGQPGTDTFIYLLEAMITLWRCQCTHASGHGVKAAADIMGIVISVSSSVARGVNRGELFFHVLIMKWAVWGRDLGQERLSFLKALLYIPT